MVKIETGRRLEILLQIQRYGESYGHQIFKRSGKTIPRGTVYVTLGRLEEEGILESRPARDGENGHLRFYKLTNRGRRHLNRSLDVAEAYAEWRG